MEGEHTPTIIQLIRSTDLAVIQFKDSHIFFIFQTIFWFFFFSLVKIVILLSQSRVLDSIATKLCQF